MSPHLMDQIENMLYQGTKGAAQEFGRIIKGTLTQMRDDLLSIPLEVSAGVVSSIGEAFIEVGPSLAEVIITETPEETEEELAAREFEEQLQAIEDEKNEVLNEVVILEETDESDSDGLDVLDDPLQTSEDLEFAEMLSGLEDDSSNDSTSSDDSNVEDYSNVEEESGGWGDDSPSYDSGSDTSWDSGSESYSSSDYDSSNYDSGDYGGGDE